MLLFVTAAVSDETIERPRRWTRLAMRDDTGLVSTVFWKVATADDAGSTVRVVLSDRRKTERL